MLAVAAMLLAGCSAWVERWVYHPSASGGLTPGSRGLGYEDLRLVASDGVTVHAWWVPGTREGPAIVFLHGNAGNLSDRVDLIVRLHERLGLSILALDYRGYGRSDGRPTQSGLLGDALAAVAEARRRADGPVVLFGRSLGAAVALHTAARTTVEGLVLEGAFTRVADLARFHYPVLSWPFRRYLEPLWDNLALAPEVKVPALFLHGDRDQVVPIGLAWRLYDRYGGPKRFRTIPGAGHDDPAFVGGEPYWNAWVGFLGGLTPSPEARAEASLKNGRGFADPSE
ncbi:MULTISPECIES: alpha/beta hydrolase [Deferrisoma]